MAEVVTRGSGEHEQIADRAQVQVTFATRGADRATAVAALGSRVQRVEPMFGTEGVEVRSRRMEVQTAWENRRRTGCSAWLVVTLRVQRVDVLEDLLDALVAAEPESLHGPHWELDDDSEAVAFAQQRAVADARRRAEGYAAALGARLGPLQSISEAERPEYRAVALSARSAEATGIAELGLEPTPVTVSVTCTAVWTLLD